MALRTRYGSSLWQAGVPVSRRPSFNRLSGQHTAEVVVVGGGLTGCTLACQFARAGVGVVLLEAGRIAESAALDAGWIVESPGVSFRTLQEQHGLRRARHVFEASRRAALDAAAWLRRLRVRCEQSPRDAVLVARTADELRRLEREHQARAAAGLEAAWLPARRVVTEVRVDGALGAIKTHGEARVNPYLACTGIVKAAVSAGAQCFDRTRVRKVRFSRKTVEVLAESGSVVAQTVVIATGVPKPLVGALQRHVRVDAAYTLATAPLSAPLRRAFNTSTIVRDMADPLHVIALTDQGRLVLQGGDSKLSAPRAREAALVSRVNQLLYEVSVLYPAMSGVMPEFAWSAARATGRDGLMLVGPHRNFPRHLFAVGIGQAGLAGAYLASRILLRHLQDDIDRNDEIFGFTRL
jgi:gamma-glutamylputrescine oxidase